MPLGLFSLKNLAALELPDGNIRTELQKVVDGLNARVGALARVQPNGKMRIEECTETRAKKQLYCIPGISERLAEGHPFETAVIDEKGGTAGEHILGLPVLETFCLLLVFDAKPFFRRKIDGRVLVGLQSLILREGSEARSLHNMGKAAIRSLLQDESEVDAFQATLRTLLSYTGCELGTIWEYHKKSVFGQEPYLTLEGTGGHEAAEYDMHCLRQGSGLVWQSLSDNRPRFLFKRHVSADEIANKSVCAQYKDKNVLLIRLESQGVLYGVACVAGVPEQKLPHLEDVFQTFIDVAVLQIRNRKASRRLRLLEAVPDIVPGTVGSIRECCAVIVDGLRRLLDVQAASVFLKPDLDGRSQRISLQAASVDPRYTPTTELQDFWDDGKPIVYTVDKSSLSGLVVLSGRPILSNRVRDDDRNSGLFREIIDESNETWVGVPLTNAKGECVGLIRCTGKLRTVEGQRFDYIFIDSDVLIMQQLAGVLAPMFDTLRSVSQLDSLNTRLKLSERIREHELKAPLAAINANTSFVLKYLHETSATSKSRRLQDILSDVAMCAFLVKESTVVTADMVKENLTHESPRTLVVEVVTFVQRLVAARSRLSANYERGAVEGEYHVTPFMDVDYSGTGPRALVNRVLMQRVFYNLAINAVKYGNPKGELKILISQGDGNSTVVFDFRDTGIGMSAADESRVFEPEFRSEEAKKRCSGEGLGLSIAKEIVEAHGGELHLVSRRNPTIFRVVLPVVGPSVAATSSMDHPGIVRLDAACRIVTKR